jgi:hypothetical protein
MLLVYGVSIVLALLECTVECLKPHPSTLSTTSALLCSSHRLDNKLDAVRKVVGTW